MARLLLRALRTGVAAALALVCGLSAGPAAGQAVSQAPARAGTAADTGLLPAQAFFSPPKVLDIALSPSGARLAITAQAANKRVGVFVVDLRQAGMPITRAALFDDADVQDFHWQDDERLVFGLTDLQVGLGEMARTAPGLFAVRFDGKEFRALVERQGRPLVTNGDPIRTLRWNHVLLHVPVPGEQAEGARADEVVVGQMAFRRNDLVQMDPLWLNTRTGQTRSLDLTGWPPDAVHWWFTPQGVPRLVRTLTDGNEALHWYTPAQDGKPGAWRRLAEAPLRQLPFQPLWVGQGERLFVRQARGRAGEAVVAPFDFAAGAPGDALVTAPGFDFNGQLLGDRAGQRLLGVRIDTDAEQTVWFDPAMKAAQERVDARLPGRVNRISCRRCGSADAVMVVRSYADRLPGELLLWRQADNDGKGGWQRISTQQPGIDPERMATVDLHRIRARDGRDLPVWLTRPAGMQDKGDARAAIVLVHGGPWVRQGRWRWDPMVQFLASRGWLVIEPEFRGSDGYGRAHLEAGFRQWGQAMQDDVADALLWARAQGLANDRACIAGGSYGGYSALMGLVRHPQLYRCASAWVAVTDPFLYLEGSWWVNDDISAVGRRYALPTLVGDAEKDRAMLLANSPLAQADRIQAPLQLIWGGEDRRVPITHGERLRSALKAAGRPPEWIVYPDEAHGFTRGDNRIDMARQLERFFRQHLQPGPAPGLAPVQAPPLPASGAAPYTGG